MQKLIYHQMKLKQILILTSTVIQLLFKTRKDAVTMHYTFWLRDFAKYSIKLWYIYNEFHSWFDDVAKTTGIVFIS